MKIGILGTGMVGNTLGTKLVALGHEVKMGARDAKNEKAAAWVKSMERGASQGTFADAAAFGEVLINCTGGAVSLAVLESAGAKNLAGKVVIDVSNPLDFSKGMPPTLTVCNTDSVGEQLQRAFPEAKIVKALNTLTCSLMVNPGTLSGEHDVFICGNDAGAKKQVASLLEEFGWKNIVDMGDIAGARGMEMLMPFWLRMMGVAKGPTFNYHIVREG